MAAAALPMTRWKPNKEEQADLDAMNIAVARIQKHTPTDPYFLEIPQADSARFIHHQSQRYQWTRDTPFARTEKESLQYQTFHLYEQGKEMFEQHSTRLEAAVSNRPANVRVGTPSTAPKNKISLAAYKKKQNAATTTPEMKAQKANDAPGKQAAVKGPVERAKAETEEMLAAIAESEPEVPAARKKESQVPVNDLKRKREEREHQEMEERRKTGGSREDLEPVAKKAKPMEDKPTERRDAQQRKAGAAASTNGHVASSTSNPDEHRLPPRLSPALSPLLPSRLSPLPNSKSSAMSLPPRLSSTIPSNIAKTLDAQKDATSASQSSLLAASETKSKEKEARLTPSKKDGLKTIKHKSPVPPRNGFRASSSSPAVRAEAEEKLPAATSAPQDDEIAVAKAKKKPADNLNDTPILQKPRLLLKLKYRKSQASAIKRILGMRAAPKKPVLADPPDSSTQPAEASKPAPTEKVHREPKEDGVNLKGVAQKVGPAKKEKKEEKQPTAEKRPPMEKPANPSAAKQPPTEKRPVPEKQPAKEKRPLPDEDRNEPSAKRSKDDPPAVRKGPSTPAQQMNESPTGSKQQLQATPSARNNLLAVTMARDKSQDSNSTQTPPAAADTPSTSSTSQPNGIPRPPSSQPSSKTALEQAWGAEGRQFNKLGKELKHAASAHQNNILPNSAVSIIDQKLAAVKSIESFLCFMIGFVCLDEAGQAAEPRPRPPEIRNWQSLLGFQRFVKHNTEQFPALAGLTASLNMVFAQRTLEIATQFHREEGISRNDFFDLQALMTKSAIDVDAKLDGEILRESFPRSWGKRAKKVLAVHERLEAPGKLGGEFRLPVTLATSPLRAVRAGVSILREWLDGEGISYGLKLKLGGGG